MYGYYITQAGADLMAQALTQDASVTITQCAVGDGGDPEAEKNLNRIALNNETYRKSFDIEDSYSLSPNDTDTLMIECVIPSDAGELTVSEIGFFDDTDTLIAYGTLKEQKLNTAGDGLDYSLDIVSFIELTSDQLSVLKVDLGKANVQAISERVDTFESTVNSTVDQYKTDLDNSWNEHVTEYETKVDGKIKGIEDTLESLNLSGDMKDRLDTLEKRVNSYHPQLSYLCDGHTFNDKVDTILAWDVMQTLIFTFDSPPPEAKLTDLSRDNDMSVVGWGEDTTIYVSAYGNTIMANPSCRSMFTNTHLTTIEFLNFDTSEVEEMGWMFEFSHLTNLDLSKFDTSHVTEMQYMFHGCYVVNLDISGFDTSNITNMTSMFDGCNHLVELNVSSFDTSHVTSMSGMFNECKALTNLDLTYFDTSHVISMGNMFNQCKNLTSLDLSYFDTSNVTYMANMFSGCENLISLDLSNFDTSKVKCIDYLFYHCYELTELDLSNFDLSSLSNSYNNREIFNNCSKLATIYAKDWTTQCSFISTIEKVFYSCGKLPNYKSGNWLGEYCKLIVDGGYFTDPAEAPPKPEKPPRPVRPSKPKTLEERVEDLEEAVKNGTGGSTEPETFETVKMKAEFIGDGLTYPTETPIKVVYTDAIPPSDAKTVDCSASSNGSVIKWYNRGTIYVSSKNPGTKIEIPITFDEPGINEGAHKSSIYCDMTIQSEYIGDADQDVEFANSYVTEIDFSNAIVPKDASLERMFYMCSRIKYLDLTTIFNGKPEDLSEMFALCNSIVSIDVTGLDVSAVKYAYDMFSSSQNLKYIYCNDDWTTNESIANFYCFAGCTSLVDSSEYDSSLGNHCKPIVMGGYFTPKPNLEQRMTVVETDLIGLAEFLDARI